MSRLCAYLSIGIGLAGCAPGSAPPPVAAAPTPAAITAETANPPVPTSAPNSPPPPPSPLHVRVQTDHGLSLFSVDGAVFVRGAPIFGPLIDGRVVRDDTWSKGPLGAYGDIVALAGTYPSNLWMAYVTGNGRIGWGELFRWAGNGWQMVGQLPRSTTYLGVSGWSAGSVIALIDGPKPHFARVAGPGGALPELAAGKGDCATRLQPHDMRALPSGHVFVFGNACGEPQSPPAIEWWAPGETKSHVQIFPVRGGDPRLYGAVWAIRSERDVYLSPGPDYDAPLLVHFDGASWSVLDPPDAATPVSQLAVTPDGTLWAGVRKAAQEAKNVLFKRSPGGAWQTVPLPSSYPFPVTKAPWSSGVTGLAVVGNDLWVAANGALLSTSPAPKGPEQLDWPAGAQLAATTFRRPKRATKDCESLFVLLYQFSKVTPDDYDFPLTRKALAGQTQFAGSRFVVTTDGGQRYFGAFPPNYDLGTKMVDRIAREVPSSTPALLCAKPDVVRELKLDLKTGEVVK